MLLVHFKSRDLESLHKQGQFWHIFFPTSAAILSQDERDTWTTHLPVSLDSDLESLDPYEAMLKIPIDVDEILVKSSWRPNIYIADRYASDGRHVFLSGDSAHQDISTGFYRLC
jgi:FAD-dependent monooxygenase